MRSVEEWIGKTDDSAIPPRVKGRIYRRYDGLCSECGRVLRAEHIAFDHIIALANGGENRESNIQPLCVSPCHLQKTITDVAIKSKIARIHAKRIGIKRKSGFQTNRNGKFRKKMDGTVVLRSLSSA